MDFTQQEMWRQTTLFETLWLRVNESLTQESQLEQTGLTPNLKLKIKS